MLATVSVSGSNNAAASVHWRANRSTMRCSGTSAMYLAKRAAIFVRFRSTETRGGHGVRLSGSVRGVRPAQSPASARILHVRWRKKIVCDNPLRHCFDTVKIPQWAIAVWPNASLISSHRATGCASRKRSTPISKRPRSKGASMPPAGPRFITPACAARRFRWSATYSARSTGCASCFAIRWLRWRGWSS